MTVTPLVNRTARFRYCAADSNGLVTRGVVDAADPAAAKAAVSARSLYLLEMAQERRFREGTRAIPSADVALGARLLADLLDSGLPLSRALAALREIAPGTWQPHLPLIQEAVTGGASLSHAFSATSGAVPSILVALVRAGEAGAGLAGSLRSVADRFEAVASARTMLLSALTYPAFLLAACAGSLALLVGVVLPRFAEILGDLGQDLPRTTALLMRLAQHGPAVGRAAFVVGSIIAIALHLWRRTPKGRIRFHALVLRVPIIGEARRAWATASLFGVTGSLVAAGVPLPSALQYGATACGDASIGDSAQSARQDVIAGARLSDAFTKHGGVSSVGVRMVRAGEQSGALAALLQRAARMERERSIRTVTKITNALAPAMVLGVGIVVAFVAAALLQAIYAVRPQP